MHKSAQSGVQWTDLYSVVEWRSRDYNLLSPSMIWIEIRIKSSPILLQPRNISSGISTGVIFKHTLHQNLVRLDGSIKPRAILNFKIQLPHLECPPSASKAIEFQKMQISLGLSVPLTAAEIGYLPWKTRQATQPRSQTTLATTLKATVEVQMMTRSLVTRRSNRREPALRFEVRDCTEHFHDHFLEELMRFPLPLF